MMNTSGRRSFLSRAAGRAMRHVRALVPRRPRPAILMYHRVAEETFDPWALAVSPGNFAGQLQWLLRNRTVLPLDEFAARHRDGSLPETAIALTFDDGYACAAQVAAPILEDHNLPATIFLPVELIDRGSAFWWDALEDLVLGFDGDCLTVGDEVVRLGEKRGSDGDWRPGSPPSTPRQAAFLGLWSLLRPLPPSALDSALAELWAQADAQPASPGLKRPMTPDEVRSTASSRIAFGSHALTHPWLTALGYQEKAREIRESFGRCEALTGTRPASFAYPYGNFDDEAEEIVADSGFLCACATGGSAVSVRSGLFRLPRVQAGNWSGSALGRALAAAP